MVIPIQQKPFRVADANKIINDSNLAFKLVAVVLPLLFLINPVAITSSGLEISFGATIVLFLVNVIFGVIFYYFMQKIGFQISQTNAKKFQKDDMVFASEIFNKEPNIFLGLQFVSYLITTAIFYFLHVLT